MCNSPDIDLRKTGKSEGSVTTRKLKMQMNYVLKAGVNRRNGFKEEDTGS